MARVKVQVNRKELTNHLRRNAQAQAALEAEAKKLVQAAEERADAFRNTGHYAARFYVRKFRYGFQVVNGDTFAFMVEWGTKKHPRGGPTPAYRPLTTAARQVFGNQFSDRPKPEGD